MNNEEVTKVAVVQLAPDYMNLEGTLDIVCGAVERAGKKADVIVFPETFVPGYPYWRNATPGSKWAKYMVEYQKNSVRIPDDLECVLESARDLNVHVVLGVSESDTMPGSLTLYNTIVFIDSNGTVIGRHRKLMPTHGERMVWGLGDGADLRTYDTEFGKIGGLICYENHMTPVKSLLALMGEEIHAALWPGYWAAEKHTANKRRFDPSRDSIASCDIDCAVREYAFETQTFVISANMFLEPDVLPEGAFDIAAGGSAVVNPSGLYIQEPVFDRETIIYAELDPVDRLATKAYFDCIGHYARWDVVRLLYRARRNVPVEVFEETNENVLSSKELETLLNKFEIELKKIEDLVRAISKEIEGE